nr:hypothetical protein [Microbacterium lacticum]
MTSGTPIVAAAEIADATEALQSLIETRTGLRLDTREPADSAADARAIVLEIAGDGAADSYRLDAPPWPLPAHRRRRGPRHLGRGL